MKNLSFPALPHRTWWILGAKVWSGCFIVWRKLGQVELWTSLWICKGDSQTEDLAGGEPTWERTGRQFFSKATWETKERHSLWKCPSAKSPHSPALNRSYTTLGNIRYMYQMRFFCAQVPADLIVGADTVVTMDGQIFEKPKDESDAFDMLSR